MTARPIFTLIAALLPLTGGAQAQADSTFTVAGVYHLVTIGGRLPEYHAGRGACDVPVFSRYTFSGGRWVNLDTVRALAPNCREGSVRELWLLVRNDSGYYRIAHDTLNLYVDDVRIGLGGWVNRALIKGDTLLFRGGEFDPGDYLYARARRDLR
jgi:hypothetical protein